MVFSESRLKEIEEIKHRYPEGRHKSALLPVLHLAQEDHGWLPVDVMDEVAKVLDLHPIEVYEVATFYTMFHVKPVEEMSIEIGDLRFEMNVEGYLLKKQNETLQKILLDLITLIKTLKFQVTTPDTINGTTTLLLTDFTSIETRIKDFKS